MSGCGPAGTRSVQLALLGVGAEFISQGWPSPLLVGYGPLLGVVVGRLVVLPLCGLILQSPI